MASIQYHSERDRAITKKTNALLKELPPFCAEFFRSIQDNTTALTRYAYTLDLKLFFSFLAQNASLKRFYHKTFNEIKLRDLETLETGDIEDFLAYVSLYSSEKDNARQYENHERAKARKLSSLRAFFKYFVKRGKLEKNVASLVDAPKLHEKPIVRLEANEAADLLDEVENGSALSSRQKQYHKHTQLRDTTIIMLFLSTGIRISELVGLNRQDINFDVNGFRVTRKGGSQVILYFNDEMADLLKNYLEQRDRILPSVGHEDALFLSMQKRRISTRAVQNLVKKYTKASVPLKNISPHKLRSTFGTMLYQETSDIYLVADVLGHKDINTTRKHYAEQSDQNRRKAARVIHLRDEQKKK